MTDSKDKDFNETLRRMMEAPPKEHKDMKKGRKLTSWPENGPEVPVDASRDPKA